MASEISEIARFLRATAPFDELDDRTLAPLSRAVEVSYRKAGEVIIEAGERNDHLYIVRSGAVELMLAGDELSARLEAGSCFAYPSLLRGGEVRNTTSAIEDTLLYSLPAERFHALRERHSDFAAFFARDEAARLSHALKQRRDGNAFSLDDRPIAGLIARAAPVTCAGETTIAEAVALMAQRDVSTLAICDDGALVGIFTDKDLRKRVVAKAVALDTPISAVMTRGPRTLGAHAPVAEAMALMASGGFRHLPVLDERETLLGVLSATDILSAIGSNAIDTGMMIAKAKNEEELIAAARRVPESFAAMVSSGVHAGHAMRFASALGEACHRRAASLAEEELGPPPRPYALVVFGSLAREEQLIGSDQDNGLIIADAKGEEPVSEPMDHYFAALGTRISDLLNACGYIYCSGGIMAKNAEQRLTLNAWCKRYESWITRPDEDRVMRATIFFDMRTVHGDRSLTQALRHRTLKLVADNSLFISFLARDAMRSKVPLGIFRNLVLDRGEDGQKIFDAKSQTIMPIIDIARTQALAAGLEEVGTVPRLRALAQAGRMNADDARSLEDALLFVNELRIAHQARQVERGDAPDNAIAPYDLSPLERDYLKDAFAVVRDGLDALRRNYAGGIA
ncbi:MAG: putative nucleotidyltransferase substrate binding domain-containing protein [Erythrobacter sp.]|uniref:putative nucleotidyltransferase substrate binding domain-containing protein n=1 Tax=Erythrobacter sp. TaxID=1042 RepID=UPI00261E48DC|nr:putative nucleotidyltransferase substrate binding domain-containing protein [Erythrobacter sp.]MDJ0979635.1 putative nucleotidyltransferase substrate binding domain-containing protein [Erythrobacter sp.]